MVKKHLPKTPGNKIRSMSKSKSFTKLFTVKTFPWLFAGIFLLALIIRLIYYFKAPVIWWDEAIYVGMAKNLFSNGILGYWENFRPPVLPITLGVGWFVGIPVLLWANIIQLTVSLGAIFMVYVLGEKIYKHSGIVAAAILMAMPVFLDFGDKILTSIPATLFALIAIWMVYKKKWYLAGLFLSLALLTRYVMGMVTLAVGISVIISWLLSKNKLSEENINKYIKKVGYLILGFATTVLPYLIINQFMFKDALYPFKEGSRVFSQYNNWLYDLGIMHYINQLFIQNYLLIFFIVGLLVFVLLKKWNEPAWNSLLLSAAFLAIYFFSMIHKESRFMIPVWIMLSVFAGFGIIWIINLAKKYSKLLSRVAVVLFVFAFLFAVSHGLRTEPPSLFYESPMQDGKADFYHFFENGTMQDKMFIASSPLYTIYTNKPYTVLRSWELSGEVYRKFIDKIDYIAIDQCDHPCEPGTECEIWRDDFLTSLDTQYGVVFKENYTRWDESICDVKIWKIK